MKRKIELAIIGCLVLVFCAICCYRFFGFGVLKNGRTLVLENKIEKNVTVNVSLNDEKIPPDVFYIENAEKYISDVEKIFNELSQGQRRVFDRIEGITRKCFVTDKIKNMGNIDIQDRYQIMLDEQKRIAAETDFRKIAKLPVKDFSPIFDALEYIKLEKFYILDYLYYFDMSTGIPFVYARKVDEPPLNKMNDIENWEKYLYKHNIKNSMDRPFLEHIELDQSPQSYFQLSLLAFYCDHFFLYWHANYRDETMLSDSRQFDGLLDSGNMELESMVDSTFATKFTKFKNNLNKYDLKPHVIMRKDTVQVVFNYFTQKEGLFKLRWLVSKGFTHKELGISRELIIRYQPSVIL